MHSSSTNITISFSRGWLVTFASAALGLVFGVLYVWSVVKGGIPDYWGWSNADKAMPYSIMVISFSFIMVPAGQLQDRFGPRLIIMLGGFLTGLGCIVSGFGGSSLAAYVLGLGVITGAGVGFGYSALTPAAIKWFPSEKTGLIAGIVVAGSGLAPLPLAPLTAWLLKVFSAVGPDGTVVMGIGNTLITLGVVIWVMVGCFVWFVYNPPLGFVPISKSTYHKDGSDSEFTWKQMMGTTQFWLLFIMYFSGASAGLVFISVAADLGKQVLGDMAFIAVVIIAVGNSLGRILAGIVSDKIGRQLTLFYQYICQATIIGLLYWLTKGDGAAGPIILVVVFMIGLNYGSNLTIFPATCKDFFGMRNFGLNYGCMFTAFGFAGLIMPWLNGFIKDATGKPDLSYFLIIILLLVSAVLSLISRHLGPPVIQSTKEN